MIHKSRTSNSYSDLIDICSKYAWVVPLKDKEVIIASLFQKILDKSGCGGTKSDGCKLNKIWVDKGVDFYNRSLKWLQDNDIGIYSTQ